MKVNHTGFCMAEMDTDKCYDCPTVKECLAMYAKDILEPVVADLKRAEMDARRDGVKDILEVLAEEVEPEPPGCSSTQAIYREWERDNDEANDWDGLNNWDGLYKDGQLWEEDDED